MIRPFLSLVLLCGWVSVVMAAGPAKPAAAAPVQVAKNPPTKITPEMDPPIRKGAMVSVQSYDRRSDTYKLILTQEPAVGPNVATRDALLRAVNTLDPGKVRSKPEHIVGNEYMLDAQLDLLSQRGVALRAQKLKALRTR